VNRAGPDENGAADAGEGGADFLDLAGDKGQVRHFRPGGLVGLLDAVDQRATLDRGRSPDRLDPPVGVGQPGRGVQFGAEHIARAPLAADDQVPAFGVRLDEVFVAANLRYRRPGRHAHRQPAGLRRGARDRNSTEPAHG
jgi:hypothetical protein